MNARFTTLVRALALPALGGLLLTACSREPEPAAPPEQVGQTSQKLFANGGFESDPIGTQPPSSWTETTYLNFGITQTTPQTTASLNLTPGGTALTETVGSATGPLTATDPDVPLTYPFVGLRSARVNSLGGANDGTGRNVNAIDQTMTVTVNDVDPKDGNVHLRMVVAPVLENPNHAYVQQPYYFIQLKNVTRNTFLLQDFNASAQPGVTWLTANDRNGVTAYYTNWSLIDISPGSASLAIGDTVDLTIYAAGCAAGGHWGRIYVDGLGPTIPVLNVEGTGPSTANVLSNITYTLTYTNGSAVTTNGTSIAFTTPPNTTFQSASLAGCSGLAAGATGTETCSIGTLAPGASGTMTVTVQVAAGTAVGTVITAGQYQISATGVPALIGNKINTAVTAAAVFADLSVTKNDGVTAIIAGGNLTYTVVASNAGPNAVLLANVADTPPASLTNVAWTCVASAGSSCTASGTNTINDSAVSLLSGGTATYTMTAKVAVGATGSIINNVTITPPAAITDPFPANNSAGDTDTVGTADTLTVTKNAPQGGTVTSIPAAISCGTACTTASGSFLDGSTVILSETPAAGWTFVGWTGACTGSGSTCTFTTSGTPNVSAKFTGPPSAVAVNAGGTQSTVVNTAFPTPLSVLVTDVVGDPLAGVTVTYAVPGSGASATLSFATAVTNASGIASVTATANTIAGGPYTVTASVSGVATAASFSLTNTPAAAATITASAGTPQSTTVNTAFATQLKATVADSFGNPISGATVTFTAPATTGPSATLTVPAVTNAAGQTTVTATADTKAGTYAVTAATVGAATPASFALTNTPGAAAQIIASSGTPQSAAAGTAFGAPLVVTVADQFGNPIQGATVAFSDPLAGASAALTAPAVTNASGQTSVVATANGVPGSYSVTATVNGVSTTFSLTNTAGSAATIAVVSGTPQSAAIGTAFAAPLVAVVKDTFGNPVSGVSVAFTATPVGGATATIAGSPALSNASGLVSVSATAGTVAGTYTVNATLGLTTATFTLTNTAGAAATITVSSGSPQTTVVGAPFALPLVALVKDSGGNVISGAPVTFTAPGSGASALITGSPATTGVTGLASVTAKANAAAGTYSVVATSGTATSAAFSLTNTAAAPASIAVSSGNNQTTTVSTAFGAPLVAVVKDASGNPVSGAVVTFTAPATTGASATIATSPATTNASGLATVNATADATAGSYTVSASTVGVAGSAAFSLTNSAGTAASITVSSGNNQTGTVGTAFGAPLVALVKDASNNPISGATVTFTAPGTGASASIVTSPTTTNASGLATVAATANLTAGTYAVTASTSGVASSASFTLTNKAGAAATVSVSSGSGQTAQIGTGFGNPLVAIVKDTNGNVVSGAAVTFTPPTTGASASITGSPATTTSAGFATVTALANLVTGTYNVVASSPGATSATFSLTNTAGAAATITVSSGSNQTTVIGTSFPAPLVALVRDASGNPVPNVSVSFAPPALGASASIATSPATTDASGLATVTATANTTTGAYAVVATTAGVALPASFGLTNTAGAPATIAVSSGSGQTTTVGTAFLLPLVALVSDASGNPVANATVTFSPPGTGASAVVAGSPATTNALGLATVTVTANSVAGAYAVTASVPGASSPASFSLTNTAGAPATIAVSAGNNQSAMVGTAFAAPLVALVSDASGNPVANATVTFVSPLTGASAALGGSPATTDSAGHASVTATANSSAGTYSVTASVLGASSPATFTLTNTAGAPANIVASSGNNQTTIVNTAFAQPLVALVTDGSGNPVAGVQVTFAPPSSGASAAVAGSPATTNALGLASVTATANGTTGTYAVNASVPGGAAPAAFTLTNAAGQATQISVVSGTPQTATVAQTFAAPLVALVTDANNNPVPGAQVAFAVPMAGASAALSSLVAVADNAGRVSVTATANTVAGAYSVTASLGGVATPATFALTNLPGAAVGIAAAPGSTPQSTLVSTPFPVPLGVIVVDTYGNPVPGITVTFASPGASPSATLSATTGTTDASGTTSVTATADAATGVYVVTGTLPNGTEVNFTLTNAGTAPSTITVSSGAPASAVVGTAFAAPLVALVKDGTGAPIANALVTFTAPALGATAQLSAQTALTNASGLAQVTANASQLVGSYSVIATATGTASPALFKLTNTPGAPATIVAAPASSPQATLVSTAFALPLIVTVSDSFGNPVPGVTATFTTPASGASATLGTIAPTDANGQISVIATANATVGTYSVSASVSGVTNPATFQLTNLSTSPDSIQVKSGSPQSTVVGTAFGSQLVVLVLDPLGNPAPGVTVTFSAPTTAATATLGSTTAVTDSSGLAQTSATASNISGQYNVVATVVGGAASANFALTNTPGTPASITASASSTPQSAQVNTAYANPLIITVADSFGNGVPGVTVTYAPPASGASVSLAATQPTTGPAGTTSLVAIANAIAGSFSVTATVTGISSPATFALTNTASAPSQLIVTSGGGQSTEATTAFANPVVLVAQDSLGNPVPNASITVTLPTTGASATFTPAAPTTDASGTVSIQFTANAHVGTYAAAFSVAGSSSPTSVNLTNTAIPTTTVLTLSTTTPVAGDTITLTAVVSSTTGTPSGTVTFFAGTTQLGTATIAGGGAVLTATAPGAGVYPVTAVYGASDPFATSTSNSITMTVSGGGTDGGTEGGAPDGGTDGGIHDGGVDSGHDGGPGVVDSGTDSGTDAGAPDATTGAPDAGEDGGADATVGEDGGPVKTPGSPGSIEGGGCTCTNANTSSGAPAGTGLMVGLALAAFVGRSRKRRASQREASRGD